MNLATIDVVVLLCYGISIITLGLYVSRSKKGEEKSSKDYFLAGNTLTWWAVGSSLIASNISAEQFVGMSGAGYKVGIGIASYELMAAVTLVIVAKFFLPIFIKRKIYTMPQFLEQRFDGRVKTVLAVFWLAVFVVVNLTSVLYLGALTIEKIVGWDLTWGIVGLALFSVVYSLYGGLMAVAWTDVVQVIVLLIGGVFTTWIALDNVSGGQGVIEGAQILIKEVPDKFHLIIPKGSDAYMDLPGISVLVGGMWIVNLYYWGCNQYITQRALAAKSLEEAQKGILFAGFLKILMPLLVVIPGVAAFYMTQAQPYQSADQAYPELLKLLPTGVKGLAFAGLMAAIVSSLSSMLNSFSTIFTMDIYLPFINKKADDKKLLQIGRVSMLAGLSAAVIIAKPLLGNFEQAFKFIQDLTGMVSPGILTVFLAGFFWRRATSTAALVVAVGGFGCSVAISYAFPQVPFIDRMGIVFLFCVAMMYVVSKFGQDEQVDRLDWSLFKTSRLFNVLSVLMCLILAVIYTVFW